MKISIREKATDFAEDKDVAARIREKNIRPLVGNNKIVTIDFTGVSLTTQSFIHALISDILRTNGEKSLNMIIFKGCNKGVSGLIKTVVQYSLDTVDDA